MPIHPTAVIDSKAELGDNVEIGAFAVVEAGVQLGAESIVAAHAQLLGRVEVGPGCRIGPGAVIGGLPQDASFDPATPSGVRLGPGNDLREHVTIHRSTKADGWTILGEKNILMVGAHMGHDSQIGDANTFANHVLLGGHVQVGNAVFLGGGCGVHQFARIGDRVMVQGLTAVSMDLPPYIMVSGRNTVHGLNAVGLRRANFSKVARAEIKDLYRLFFREPLSKADALEQVCQREDWSPEASHFLEFIQEESIKGVCFRSKKGRISA